MGLFDLLRAPTFGKVILLVWLFCSVLLVFLIQKIDSIVHGQLYNFGLQFSYVWADPYWNALHLIYVLLAVPGILSAIALIAGLAKPSRPRVVKRARKGTNRSQLRRTRNQSASFRCANCGRVFSKPKTMLTLRDGKLQSANVCPYCKHVLGKADERHPSESVVVEPDQEEVEIE